MGRGAFSVVILSLFMIVNTSGSWAEDPDLLYVFESPNPETGGWFGFPANPVGDVNNDGYDDIGIAGSMENVASLANAGRSYIFSGATGGLLRSHVSPNPQNNGEFGFMEGIGDVNDDDCDDYAIAGWRETVGGLFNAGRVYVYSGSTGDTLYSFESPDPQSNGRFGSDVGGAGDWNDDGCPDILIGAYWEDSSDRNGRVYVFSGLNGACLDTLTSPNPATWGKFGFPTVDCGDVNGDGHDDILVGAKDEHPGASPDCSGMAYVFSGATGDLIYEISPKTPVLNGYFGYGASGAGDVNEDGYADILIGEPGGTGATGIPNVGRAYLYSGFDGELLQAFQSPNFLSENYYGGYVSGCSDWDGDGYDDIIITEQEATVTYQRQGRAYIYSGATYQLRYTIDSVWPAQDGLFGVWVSNVSDMNGDGFPDVAISSLRENGGAVDAGRVYVFSLMQLHNSIVGGEHILNWSTWPSATEYWVYGAENNPYFVPGVTPPYQYRVAVIPAGTTTWSTTDGVNDPDHNWTYQIGAAGTGFPDSPRTYKSGECDYGITINP